MNISISIELPEHDVRTGAALYELLQNISPAQCEGIANLEVDELVEIAEGIDAFRTQ